MLKSGILSLSTCVRHVFSPRSIDRITLILKKNILRIRIFRLFEYIADILIWWLFKKTDSEKTVL